jgi:hypothetical protein
MEARPRGALATAGGSEQRDSAQKRCDGGKAAADGATISEIG